MRKRFGRLYYRRHGSKTIESLDFDANSSTVVGTGTHFDTEGHAEQLFVGMTLVAGGESHRIIEVTDDENFEVSPNHIDDETVTTVFTTPILGDMLASAMVSEVGNYWREFAKVEMGAPMNIDKGDNIGLSTGDNPVISENAKIEMNVLGVEESQSRPVDDLMPNAVDRDFSAASAWADVDLADTGSYDDAGDLSITAGVDGKDDYCELVVASAPTTVGLKYILKFDVNTLTGTWIIKSFDGNQVIGIVSAEGGNQTLVFTAESTGGLQFVAGENDAVADFDNFGLVLYSTSQTIEGRWSQLRTAIHQKLCDLMFFTDNLSDPYATIYSEIFGSVEMKVVASDLTRLVISADKSQGSFDETNLNIPLFTVESPVWTPASGAVGANAVIISCINTRATVYWGKYDNEADLETDIDSGDAFSFHGSYVVTIDPNGTYQAQARMEGLTKSATVEAIYT